MKLGILTQPLYNNYGGILQAYALQRVLRNMGHEPITIVFAQPERPKWLAYLGWFKRLLLKTFTCQSLGIYPPPSENEKNVIRQHLQQFIDENIVTTKALNSVEEIEPYNFDGYVVGSDQVWRPRYSKCITNFFLDFVGKDKRVIKIAYAASFGVDYWEFPPNLTSQCSQLAKGFDAISVREDSGVGLCKKNLGVNAIQVLDPVMLLESQDYFKLISGDSTRSNTGLITYILDKKPETNSVVKAVETRLSLQALNLFPPKRYDEVGSREIDQCVFQPITKWLQAFMDSRFVITDSFHGVILSIIFNKPFVAIGNKDRGMARFDSLQNMFDIKKRFVKNEQDVTNEIITDTMDYGEINMRLNEMRLKSFKFLNSHLVKG